MKAVIYTRGTRGNSMEIQEQKCREYAERLRFDVVGTITDLDEVGSADVVIVSDPTRLSRSAVESRTILAKLNNHGIAVVSAS